MADLCDLTCEACRADAPKVSAGEQEILLKDIDGWAINTDPCDMLVKNITLKVMMKLFHLQMLLQKWQRLKGIILRLY